jgi:hypothetical protein
MGERDYRSALATTRSRIPLRGRVPETPWDPQLHDAMEVSGIAIHEEEIRAELLAGAIGHPGVRELTMRAGG